MKIRNQGFDHVEVAVKDFAPHIALWKSMGFEQIGEAKRPKRLTESVLLAQGHIRVMLTKPLVAEALDRDLTCKFGKEHGEGISVLALDVDDAEAAFKETVAKGARPAMEPRRYESPHGTVVRAEIYTPSDLRYAFVTRTAPNGPMATGLFDEDLLADRLESPSPSHLRVIDHLTNNVSIGEMPKWVEWYKRVFDFEVTRHFDISTGRTGLNSDVVQSRCRKITVPINEATEPESQVQEFVERFKGPGVQHLAFLTTDLPSSLKKLRSVGMKFLTVPHTYYEAVPTRVPGVTENLRDMEELQVLIDGDNTGYLLQIFSEEIMGPFFFEFIQRKGNRGFGEGNFRALFEAIERDQVRRGVLKA